MTILHTSFHIIDIENDVAKRKEMPEEFQGFINEYVDYALNNEKNKDYVIHDEQTQVVSCVRQMALDKDFISLSDSVADKLLNCEKLAQAKIYRMGNSVKKGSLIQVLLKKDSDEFVYVVAKIEHSQWFDGNDLSKKYGFSGDKKSLWKSAVFSMYEINDHILFNTVKVYSDTQAKYWTVSFLELDESRDDAKNTYSAFKAMDNELKATIEPVSKKDYVKLSSELQNTMNTVQQFDYNSYVDSFMDDYKPSVEDVDKDVIKDCLLALPERKKFDTNFKVLPESLNNKRTKKFQLSQGIELTIKSDAQDYPDKIISTMMDGKRVLMIECEDDDTYDAFA